MLEVATAKKYIDSLRFSEVDRDVRLISILSAALAMCKNSLTREIMICLDSKGIAKKKIYETILQSYLFLGFPRMIEGALVFDGLFGNAGKSAAKFRKYSTKEAEDWFKKGGLLCRRVYGKNYGRLEKRFMEISPELFRWMVIEGYGKVLTRPGLNQIERELAEVAALIIDCRERQLLSHILGSLNVGASVELIRRVNLDIKPLAGSGAFKMAERILSGVEDRLETPK